MIRLGGHGLPIGSEDPIVFARAHAAFGYGAAYIPASLTMADSQRLADWERAFTAEDVVLAEVGIWRNLVTPDEAARKANVAYAAEKLAVADAVGARCAVSYIGSLAAGAEYFASVPANFESAGFDAAVAACRQIIDEVKPRRAKFSLEMMQYSLPDSVDSYVELIRAVDRPAFGAHLDPVNLVMTPRTYWHNAALIRECFDKLGQWLVSCHAKDVVNIHHTASLEFAETQIGDGVLDYRTYLRELDRLPREVPLMLEHLDAPAYATARDRIFAVGDDIGVAFAKREAIAA
jgi:sugar phosphate isomerase/epimerase